MSRPDDVLDPGLAAELDQLEALLGDDVRAVALTPDPAFRARLDGRIAGRSAKPRARRVPSWRWVPAVGAAAAVVVVVGVVVGLGSLPSGTSNSASSGSATRITESTPTAPEAAASGSAGSSASSPAPLAVPGRSVERGATLRLSVPARHLQRAADGVVRATQAAGGYVQQSNVVAGTRADFVLKVPTARLDDALAALGRLGHVAALEQSSTDITSVVDGADGRLGDARAERRGLLRALGKADTARAVQALRARVADNRRRLRAAELAARRAHRRADRSSVAVSLEPARRVDAPAPQHSGWTLRGGVHRAVRVLEGGASVALVVLALALLLALPLGAALLGRRRLVRRQREAALDTR